MNVEEFFSQIEVPPFSKAVVKEMLQDRELVFRGFATVEDKKGFIKPRASIASSQGQEMIRIMLFRTLEEVQESIEASKVTHVKEEIIDAMAYFLSTFMLDPEYFSLDSMTEAFHKILEVVEYQGQGLDIVDLGIITYDIASLGDVLRNRAWMWNTQSPYFEGVDRAYQVIQKVLTTLLSVFSSWEDFYLYWEAKHRVLKFRLGTNY